MTVKEFNTDKGLYIFKFNNFDTEFHTHPAIEIIEAENGTFTLWTDSVEYQNLKFAIIKANEKHKLSSTHCDLRVTMVEHHYKIVKEILFQYSIDFGTSYYSQTEPVNKVEIIQEIVHRIKNYNLKDEYDERIIKIINYLNNNNLEYNQMINTLKGVTNLSESRLSHLFKFNLGISLKRYLIWTKLKSTIKQHLNQPEDLFTSLIKSGFYDHPHFSKNFKAMLGVKASKAYNSRTLQVLPILTS